SVSSNTMMSVTDVNEYYCGLTFSGGSLTLNPGIYYVAGPITVTSAGIDVLMTGSHVMIYLSPTASLDLETNHLDMTLSAPASGDYKGIIFYQDRANSTTAVLGKNDGTLTLDGALYFPTATLTMKNENSGSTTNTCTWIVT